jgi:hypothetical protein
LAHTKWRCDRSQAIVTWQTSEHEARVHWEFCSTMILTLWQIKKHFHLSGRVNKQNFLFWAEENPQQLLHSTRLDCVEWQYLSPMKKNEEVFTLIHFVARKNSVAYVREQTNPTERPPLVVEVSANFLRIEGATWSEWRIPTAVFSVFQTGSSCKNKLKIERKKISDSTVKDEIRCNSSHYGDRLRTHPNHLALNLLRLTDNRRLRRFLPTDLPDRF